MIENTKKELFMTSENALDYLESHIPELAETAVKQAYWNTLAAGYSVLQSEDGKIYEVFPDGSKQFVKDIEAPIEVKIGQKK